MKIGFIGLGNMGIAMAANLFKAGHDLTVYNRTTEKAQPLVSQGARLARSLADACEGEIVITMLADDPAVQNVAFQEKGILESLPGGSIHVSCSTISVALSDKLASSHPQRGQNFVSAPVFGRPEAAAAAKLFVVASGDLASLSKCQPIFDAIGQRTFRFGDKPSNANLIKLSGNFLIMSVIESLSEAFALIGKGGIDQRQYFEFLTTTLFNAPVYKTYGNLMIEKKFHPAGFVAPLALKDVRLALEAAESLRVGLPLGDIVRNRLLALLANGDESLDWSAISQMAARDAGLQ
ncbi:MAG TPA: NAD(P)-dependent oxidoreductase [Terriglobales bacterium]|jgi:3-hydroxyisobutyrate dehydrogenase-like beta-hydroxyacid dehydrogenase|nr:NAD(P)-dependent oxidoreductase [Terriglobales bacterium]